MSKKRKIVLAITITAILIVIAALSYLMSAAKPMPQAVIAMMPNNMVKVTDADSIVFTPQTTQAKTGLIIYPGGKVNPIAYAPIARELANKGVKTIIVKMPFNLAVLGINKADKVIEQNSDIEKWYIAGHSLGGVMAARYAKNHQDTIDGLILWAAYPEEASDLSKSTMSVVSIYGTNDGLTQPGDISDTQHLLPESVQWVSIPGGNHSQFGWYGFQKGDNAADISREEQQKEIVEATLDLIKPNTWQNIKTGN
jgi:dienelactone hydrolase